jgi:hypothetical protein
MACRFKIKKRTSHPNGDLSISNAPQMTQGDDDLSISENGISTPPAIFFALFKNELFEKG